MMKKTLIVPALAIALSLSAEFTMAADQAPAQEKAETQEQVYGSQLMTKQERAEQRARMSSAKTAEEREQIRKEHHDLMKERARERGVKLPDEIPARGGKGAGSGMGPGSGMDGMGHGGRGR